MERPHRPDEGALVLLRREATDAEEERRVFADAQRRAGLGAGAADGRGLHAVADHGEAGGGAEAGEHGGPGRRCGVRDGDEGVHGPGGGRVVGFLRGVGDEPWQVLGPNDAHARGGAGGGEPQPFPADAGVDVQQAGADGREEAGLVRERHAVEAGRAGARREVRRGLGEGDGDAVDAGEAAPQRQHVPAEARRLGAVGGEQDVERLSHARP